MITLLDGPMGTELAARGVVTPAPMWSAAALDLAPAVVEEIHRQYARAGARVHTANTFRTTRRAAGPRWVELAERAVAIARAVASGGQRVAGSIAPLEDCYRPDLSPADPRPEHRELAAVLAAAGVDVILCETFPHVGEALIAVEEAARTGVETWLALTAGPRGDLVTPSELASGAREAIERGARAVLVNCVAATRTAPYVEALARAVGDRAPFGAYANAGDATDALGWDARNDPRAWAAYAELAARWAETGATLIGGCCGTGPGHIAAVGERTGAGRP